MKTPAKVLLRNKAWTMRNPDKIKAGKRKYYYKLSDEQYNKLLVRYNGLCHVCFIHPALEVDHDHSCCSGRKTCGKCVRGLVCKSCNLGLRGVEDNLDFGKQAAEYLKRFNSNTQSSNQIYITWLETVHLIQSSAQQIKQDKPDLDTIVALSRGGLIPARIMAQVLGIKHVYSFGINFYNFKNKLKKKPHIYQSLPESLYSDSMLVVDDIADSGKSLEFLLNVLRTRSHWNIQEPTVYTMLYKPKSTIIPHYYSRLVESDVWVNMPWE